MRRLAIAKYRSLNDIKKFRVKFVYALVKGTDQDLGEMRFFLPSKYFCILIVKSFCQPI